MRQVNGWLNLLTRPDGTLRRVVLLNGRDDHEYTHVTILWSDDGVQWQCQPLETGRSFADEQVVATSLLVVPRGEGLIAAAWAQTPGPGNARGGAFAVLSTDGGSSWSREEIIAQHFGDGRLFDDDGCGQRANPQLRVPLCWSFQRSCCRSHHMRKGCLTTA